MLQIFIILECRGGTAGNNAFHYGMDSSFSSLGNTVLLSAKTAESTQPLISGICEIISIRSLTIMSLDNVPPESKAESPKPTSQTPGVNAGKRRRRIYYSSSYQRCVLPSNGDSFRRRESHSRRTGHVTCLSTPNKTQHM